jgi:hypothetical protein
MNRRILLSLGAATGGLLAATLLPVAVAFADSGSAAADVAPSATGSDAFTLGGYTFDPIDLNSSFDFQQGYVPVTPDFTAAPFLDGGSTPQLFEAYNSSGNELGVVSTNEDVANVYGMTNTEITVVGDDPVGSSSTSLPATGTVYDVYNFGNGYENVYTDIPSASGSGAGTATDNLVTPFGDINLSSLVADFNPTAALDPGDAFSGLSSLADPSTFLGL